MRGEQPVLSPGGAPDGSGAALLGSYHVVSELGRGAAATVLRVRRPGAPPGEPDYALKILDAALSSSDAAVTAFRREAALLAGVDHPGLARIHEVGLIDGRAYLVMDLVEGESLAQLLARGPLAPERVLALALDVVDPLAALHRRGLVHRDLKPDNIMVAPSGAARLIDFGLAARAAGGEADVAVGTLAYAPPEQSGTLRRPVDNRSDLYALGAVLFECLAGRLPYAAHDVGELLRLHAVAPVPDLRELVPGVPGGLVAVVGRLLAKDPDDRYQRGEELARDLRLLAEDPERPFRPRSGRGHDTGSTPGALRGREEELARIGARWGAARQGAGGACVIRGGGGAGKSRLAAEVMRQARADGALVLHGKSTPDDPVPLAPLRLAIDGFLQDAAHLPADERDGVHARLRACAGESTGLLARLTPALAAILGPSQHGDADHQDQFTLAVAEFLGELSRTFGSLLLTLDDVQWLDPGTQRVLGQLGGLLPGLPLLVLVTARDDEDSTAATAAFGAALGQAIDLDLTLGPLSRQGVAALVGALLPGLEADHALLEVVAARAGGVPFVVQEYVRAIVDAGLLRPSWGSWLLDEEGLDALELPQDALGLVLARVQGLGPQARELLATAAVAGNRFQPRTLAAVHAQPLDRVLTAVEEAVRRGLVERREGNDVAFLHDRIREALLDDLDAEAAASLHARIAAALDAAPVPEGGHPDAHVYAAAHHYLAAGSRAPAASAVPACLAAGRLALRNHAAAEAVAFLTHAADLADAPDARVLLSLGVALKREGRLASARQRLEQALAVAEEPFLRAEILAVLGDVHRSAWDPDAARAAVEQGLAALGAALPRSAGARVATTVLLFLAAQVLQLTRLGRARGRQRQRCALAAALHEVGSYVSVIGQRPGDLVLHDLRALYWGNRIGSGEQYVRSQGAYGFVCDYLGLHRAARRAFARADADPAGEDPMVRALMAHYRGGAAYLGYADNGELWARVVGEHGRRLELAAYADMLSVLLTDAVAQGRTRAAADLWDLAQRRLALHGDETTTALLAAPSLIAAAQGRHAEAAGELCAMEASQAGVTMLGMVQLRLITRIFVLTEQDELGQPFDDAAAEFAALRLHPLLMVRSNRMIHFQIAMSRIAQCRRADPAELPSRLQQARAAVRCLRRGRRSDVLELRERIARADLQVLEGRPRRALRVLNGAEPIQHPDAPLLAYEVARVRARALHALGGVDEAHRQALLAEGIAQTQGWPHRAGWIAREFPARGDGTRTARTGTDHATRTWSSGADSADYSLAARSRERARLHALQQVAAAASRVLDPDALIRIALDETLRILHGERALLFLAEEGGERLVPRVGRDGVGNDLPELAGYSASLVERVRSTREPLVVTGTEEGAALGAQSVVLHGLRSILVAPLVLEERLLGVVYLDSQVAKGIFTADDAELLTALTNHISMSLETARAAQLEISVLSAQRQRDLAERLRAASESMAATFEPDAVLVRLLSWTRTLVGAADGAWLLGATPVGYWLGERGAGDGLVRHVLPVTQAPAALLAADEPVVGTDLAVPAALTERLPDATCWLVLPLRAQDSGRIALVIGSLQPPERLEQAREVAAALVTQGATAHDKAALFAQVQALAVEDELTGVANRRRFFEEAQREIDAAARHGRPLAALMVDIDHFKRINDTYGHQTGDDVIRLVAQRLTRQLRGTDLIGRYGGEEFALLLRDSEPGDDLPERLRGCIANTPVATRSGPLDITVSIGLAHLADADTDVATLLARADQALYAAKQGGRNRVSSR